MTNKNQSLIVVAHPDDEALFFSGLIMSSVNTKWKVICVTDGNADGNGEKRRKQFIRCMSELDINDFEHWDFPDIYENRLSQASLQKRLENLPGFNEVYTHSILGEYGHPHHQDVSYAVHHAFAKKSIVYSTAYNLYPQKVITLTLSQYQKKCNILSKIYFSETKRFMNFLPSSYHEGFNIFEIEEIETLYNYFTKNSLVEVEQVKHYRWFLSYLPELKQKINERVF